jgi:SAM-dependent methyltransferase
MVGKRQVFGRNLRELLPDLHLGYRVSNIGSVIGNSIPYDDRLGIDTDAGSPWAPDASICKDRVSNSQSSSSSNDRSNWSDPGKLLRLDQRTSGGSIFTTRGLGRFVQYLEKLRSPTVIDLGPGVGSSVAFFGERLGCKLIVEDLFTELEHGTDQAESESIGLASVMCERLDYKAGSIDGVLCWDVFDYLDKAAAESLAQQIIRILKPGGVVFALFNECRFSERHLTKYAIVDTEHIESRTYSTARSKTRWWGSRDVYKLFHGLTIGESYLLKIQIREMLFKKPRPTTGL